MRIVAFAFVIMSWCPAFCLAQAQQDPTPVSKTAPDPLAGNYGAATDAYYFRHFSDVDQAGKLFVYSHAVINDHGSNALPMEWKAAGLHFRRLKSNGGPGIASYSSGLFFEEDPRATILFGPTKQHSHDAPIYMIAPKAKAMEVRAKVPNEGAVLRSRIFGIVENEEGVEGKVDVQFSSQVKEGRLEYSAQNGGANGRAFKIPALTARIARAAEAKAARVVEKWESDERSVYSLPESGARPVMFVLEITPDTRLVEALVQLEVLDREGELLAVGPVSAYVPLGP